MDNTIFVSFVELFNKELTKVDKIVIPKIQRSYAQGRTEDPHAVRTRERFLRAIHEHLSEGKEMVLDFIYGNIQEGRLIPLDGQQRLTTLFLLHWFAAKKDNVDADEWQFLSRFTYETRYSARDFCEKLVEFQPSFEKNLKEEIEDETWFPADWNNDATIKSMLVMIDAIQSKFSELTDLWEKLKGIKFYFLPLEDLKLTDDIYIKMNSRGKPLSDFENFKAEMEKIFSAVDSKLSKSIALKIDTDWTNLLWKYAIDDDETDDRPSTDDAFLKYFRFICDILCYRSNNSPKTSDEFIMLDTYFSGDDALDNIKTLEAFFDCWVKSSLTEGGKKIEDFFGTVFSSEMNDGKIKLPSNYSINLFKDCINNYSEVRGGRNRKFSLNQIILLYAAIIYIQNEGKVSASDFERRMRIVNNLVLNSSDEITDSESRVGGNRMPAILAQVDSIILHGIISDDIHVGGNTGCINFNVIQLQEEKEKQLFTIEHPELAKALFDLEDHPLLTGQIGVIGLDSPGNFTKFQTLFECDWDLIDCALLAIGDYSQRDNNWRIQLGTSNKGLPKAWTDLFHQSRSDKGFSKTKSCLKELLYKLGDNIDNEHLNSIIFEFISRCESERLFDWRYYYVTYPSFRMGRYGKYVQYEENPYHMIGIYAAQYTSPNSKELFISEMYPESKYEHFYKTSIYEYPIKNEVGQFVLLDMEDREIAHVDIPQENGVDTVNRIEYGRDALQSIIQELIQ